MTTVTLDDDQHARAIQILKQLKAEDIHTPTDVVDTWEPPADSINQDEKDGLLPTWEGFIDPAQIHGTFNSTITHLEPAKLAKVIAWMVEGEFDVQWTHPPVVQKRGDRYFVLSDGPHRCIAAKAVGLDELYVECEEVPLELLI